MATIDESVKVVSLDTLKEEIKKKIKDDIRKTYENGMKIDADLYNLTASTYRSSPVLAKNILFRVTYYLTSRLKWGLFMPAVRSIRNRKTQKAERSFKKVFLFLLY